MNCVVGFSGQQPDPDTRALVSVYGFRGRGFPAEHVEPADAPWGVKTKIIPGFEFHFVWQGKKDWGKKLITVILKKRATQSNRCEVQQTTLRLGSDRTAQGCIPRETLGAQ